MPLTLKKTFCDIRSGKIKYRRCLFFIEKKFPHLKMDIGLIIPVLNKCKLEETRVILVWVWYDYWRYCVGVGVIPWYHGWPIQLRATFIEWIWVLLSLWLYFYSIVVSHGVPHVWRHVQQCLYVFWKDQVQCTPMGHWCQQCNKLILWNAVTPPWTLLHSYSV